MDIYQLLKRYIKDQNEDAVEYLLINYKIDLNDYTKHELLLPVAVKTENIKIITLLLEYGADPNMELMNLDPLIVDIASDPDSFEIVKLFVKFGVDIESSGEFGYSLLMAACSSGNPKIVKYVLDCGASIEGSTLFKQTPFTEANGNIINLLTKYSNNIGYSKL
jgi:ankyrin repeat protein